MRSSKVAQRARRAAATRALAVSLLALLLVGVETGAALMLGRVALLIAAAALAAAAAFSAARQVRGGAYRLLRRPLRTHQSRPSQFAEDVDSDFDGAAPPAASESIGRTSSGKYARGFRACPSCARMINAGYHICPCCKKSIKKSVALPAALVPATREGRVLRSQRDAPQS